MPDDNPRKTLELFRPIFGVMFLVGTFAIAGFIFSDKVDPAWQTVASSFLGSLLTGITVILTWAYGSSKGSEQKTEIMADTAKAAAETKVKPGIDPIGEAHDYVAKTEETVVKANIAADNAVENVEELKEEKDDKRLDNS